MFRRFFPDSIFRRRLDESAVRRLKLAQARADERIIDAHVENALMFVDTLAEDLTYDRAIDTYVRVMNVPEPLASVIATRVLVVLGQELVPTKIRRRRLETPTSTDEVDRPLVRITDAGSATDRGASGAL
jgi:hypothetical protein